MLQETVERRDKWCQDQFDKLNSEITIKLDLAGREKAVAVEEAEMMQAQTKVLDDSIKQRVLGAEAKLKQAEQTLSILNDDARYADTAQQWSIFGVGCA